MNITVLTSLYPGPPRPFEGVFAERRWVGMQTRGHSVRVVQPLPRAPWPLGGSYAAMRAMPAREEREGISVERPRYLHIPGCHRSNPSRFARAGVRRVLRRSRPDVVVLDYAWPAAAAARKLRAAGLPVVINGRGSDVLQVAGEAGLGDLLEKGLRSAGNWSAVSQDLVNAMDRLGGRTGCGVLVPNGVDLGVFQPLSAPELQSIRGGYGINSAAKLVVVVGHLIPRKNPLLALSGFLAGAPQDALLLFVGRGELQDELKAVVARSGERQRIRVLGELPPSELARLVAAADLLLLTSSREGRPNVVLEALACGTPVVATSAGGTAELLPGFEKRLLVTSHDADAVGAKIAAVLEDPPTSEEMRALVEPLTWDASFRSLESCLQAAIDGNSA
ncbi:MAG: teichuronic acid biosynthesis glycosyltransferase TuaC [Planctomycetota bacterium]